MVSKYRSLVKKSPDYIGLPNYAEASSWIKKKSCADGDGEGRKLNVFWHNRRMRDDCSVKIITVKRSVNWGVRRTESHRAVVVVFVRYEDFRKL